MLALRGGLLALLLATWWGVLDLGFVGYDDPEYVYRNARVLSGLGVEGLRYAVTTTDLGNWHPLTWLSHQLAAELGGPAPRAHHALNAVLHVLSAHVLFEILRRATGAPVRSAFAAALWALHPLRVESVAWVAERKDVLSTFLWMLALLAWTVHARTGSRRAWAGAFAAFAAGLLAKPMLVTFPFALLLLDVWPLRRWKGAGGERGAGALVREKLPFLALSAAFCAVALWAQQAAGAVGGVEAYPPAMRAANAVLACGAYLRQTLWPAGLAVFYPYPTAIDALAVAAWGVGLAALTLLVLWQVRVRPWLAVGWLWFLGTLVPVIGLVQVGEQGHADRYTYVPQALLLAALVWGAHDLSRRWRRGPTIAAAAGLAAALGLLLATRAQVEVWRDDASLFAHALRATEGNYVAHDYLGRDLQNRGRLEEAVQHFRDAVRIRPDFVSGRVNLGNALGELGQLDEALLHLREATRLAPGGAAGFANLGAALGRAGRTEEALQAIDRALELAPDDPVAHFNGALAGLSSGDLSRVARHFPAALRARPEVADDPSSLELAWVLATARDPAHRDGALAAAVAERACASSRAGSRAFEVLAAALAELGRFEEAVDAAEEGLRRAKAEGQSEIVPRLSAELGALRSGRRLRSP